MKTIMIAGNIGRNAEVRQVGGDSVASFSVAVEERARDTKRTIWFDVSIWGRRADALSRYLTKGSKVAVSGDLSTREHNGKTYLTVRANEISLMGGGEGQNQRDRGSLEDDEVPF